jgi:hypothetical protein
VLAKQFFYIFDVRAPYYLGDQIKERGEACSVYGWWGGGWERNVIQILVGKIPFGRPRMGELRLD